MSSKHSSFVVHVVLPLLVGGMIYICLRDHDMRMFQWFDFVGAGPVIEQLRLATAPLQHIIPFWIQYSVPNALWVYSLTAFMTTIWAETNSSARFLWMSLGLVLGAGTEFGQAINIIPGSFDVIDLSLCVLAAPLALFLTSNWLTIRRRLHDVTT